MTIDLDNRFYIVPGTKENAASGFLVDAPNVRLYGFTDVFSSDTSVIFGPKSDGSLLEGGTSINGANNFPEHMVLITPGADNISIVGYTMGRFNRVTLENESKGNRGMIRLATLESITGQTYATDSTPITNLRIVGTVFDNTPRPNSACTAQNGTGCAEGGIYLGRGVELKGLLLQQCEFRYMPKSINALDLGANYPADLPKRPSSDWTIITNTFEQISTGSGAADAAIHLPYVTQLNGKIAIQDNTLDNYGTDGQYVGIRWMGTSTNTSGNSTTPSNLYIEDNYFDGYEAASIMLNQAGVTTVRRNEFGPHTGSQENTILEETTGGGYGKGDSAIMMLNISTSANNRVLTWYPTDEPKMEDCELKVSVAPPVMPNLPSDAGGIWTLPQPGVTLDFYYTATNKAEEYLGSVENVTETGTVTVPKLPSAPGYIRVQTQSSNGSVQPQSSQYSRTVATEGPGQCMVPQASISLRAWADVDPDAADYASIVAKAREIPSGESITAGESVWFTYTVKNPSRLDVSDIVVRDTYSNEEVCRIPSLPPKGEVGCVRQVTPEELGL
ncbi:MAG: hypothetical protein LBJ08_05390 [Bifidobacteriaceae bacterium]|nr:hypothetical protein [Bifidobacteriaceae bacterium]